MYMTENFDLLLSFTGAPAMGMTVTPGIRMGSPGLQVQAGMGIGMIQASIGNTGLSATAVGVQGIPTIGGQGASLTGLQGVPPTGMQGISPMGMQGTSPMGMQGVSPTVMQGVHPGLISGVNYGSPDGIQNQFLGVGTGLVEMPPAVPRKFLNKLLDNLLSAWHGRRRHQSVLIKFRHS